MQLINNRVLILFSVLFFGSKFTVAQTDTVRLTGIVNGYESISDRSIKLNPYNEASRKFETTLNSDGSFNFSIPLTGPEFYEIAYGGYAKSIILTAQELNPSFKAIVTNGKPDQMFIMNSYENVAHEMLRSYIIAFRDTLKGFRPSCASSIDNCRKYWSVVIADFNMHVQQLINDYPKTITGQVLAPMSLCPELTADQSPVELLEKHYFDNTNFADKRTFLTPDIATKINGYINYIADTSKVARYAFINDMFMRARGNEEANKTVGLALYNIFSKLNRTDYLISLGEWLQTRPWSEEQLPAVTARIRQISYVVPGSQSSEIVAPDVNGTDRKLSGTVKNNKLTMALFWASDCSHCVQSLPEIEELYQKYHKSGFDIYGACMDADLGLWKKFMSDHKLSWLNVNVNPSNPALEKYYVQATPSMIMIDYNGVIVERFMDVKDAKAFLAKTFK
jgi:thiol-disulfide isomerase/thioredoxin